MVNPTAQVAPSFQGQLALHLGAGNMAINSGETNPAISL